MRVDFALTLDLRLPGSGRGAARPAVRRRSDAGVAARGVPRCLPRDLRLRLADDAVEVGALRLARHGSPTVDAARLPAMRRRRHGAASSNHASRRVHFGRDSRLDRHAGDDRARRLVQATHRPADPRERRHAPSSFRRGDRSTPDATGNLLVTLAGGRRHDPQCLRSHHLRGPQERRSTPSSTTWPTPSCARRARRSCATCSTIPSPSATPRAASSPRPRPWRCISARCRTPWTWSCDRFARRPGPGRRRRSSTTRTTAACTCPTSSCSSRSSSASALLGFSVVIAHHCDVGGRVPGSNASEFDRDLPGRVCASRR